MMRSAHTQTHARTPTHTRHATHTTPSGDGHLALLRPANRVDALNPAQRLEGRRRGGDVGEVDRHLPSERGERSEVAEERRHSCRGQRGYTRVERGVTKEE